MASASHANSRLNTIAEHLSKVWWIDIITASKILDTTPQNYNRTENPYLSQNYSTNDKMLRYKRIKRIFTDTFFETKKTGKSSRSHNCFQLFVTDKGFVDVIPMNTKSEVLQDVK